jgi:hypothetical protein
MEAHLYTDPDTVSNLLETYFGVPKENSICDFGSTILPQKKITLLSLSPIRLEAMKHPDRSPQKSFQRLNLTELGLQQQVETRLASQKPSLLRRMTEQLTARLGKKAAAK